MVLRRIGLVSIAAVMVMLLSSCGDSSTQSAENVEVSQDATAGGANASVETDGDDASSETQAPVERLAVDQLLSDEAAGQLFPSFRMDNSISDDGQTGGWPELTKVRPTECEPLMQLLGNPGDRTSGVLSSWAWSSYYFKENFYFEERIGTYGTSEEAASAFAAAQTVAESCMNGEAEYPQQGTIILGDGINRVTIEASKVVQLPNGFLLPEASEYTRDVQGVILQGNSIISMSFKLVPDEMSRANVMKLATSVAAGASTFAAEGALPTATSVAADSLNCLTLEIHKVKVLENYSDWAGKGNGDDLFIDTRLRAVNNCSQAIRGYSYDIEFKDEFDDYLLGGNGDVRQNIQPGESKLSPANFGWVIDNRIYPEKVDTFTSVAVSDLSIVPEVTKIIFTDKSTLP